jgi:IS30 family transposase
LSVDIIAEKLGRHRSTIFREIRRNVYIDKEWPELSGYHCVTAHVDREDNHATGSAALTKLTIDAPAAIRQPSVLSGLFSASVLSN